MPKVQQLYEACRLAFPPGTNGAALSADTCAGSPAFQNLRLILDSMLPEDVGLDGRLGCDSPEATARPSSSTRAASPLHDSSRASAAPQARTAKAGAQGAAGTATAAQSVAAALAERRRLLSSLQSMRATLESRQQQQNGTQQGHNNAEQKEEEPSVRGGEQQRRIGTEECAASRGSSAALEHLWGPVCSSAPHILSGQAAVGLSLSRTFSLERGSPNLTARGGWPASDVPRAEQPRDASPGGVGPAGCPATGNAKHRRLGDSSPCPEQGEASRLPSGRPSASLGPEPGREAAELIQWHHPHKQGRAISTAPLRPAEPMERGQEGTEHLPAKEGPYRGSSPFSLGCQGGAAPSRVMLRTASGCVERRAAAGPCLLGSGPMSTVRVPPVKGRCVRYWGESTFAGGAGQGNLSAGQHGSPLSCGNKSAPVSQSQLPLTSEELMPACGEGLRAKAESQAVGGENGHAHAEEEEHVEPPVGTTRSEAYAGNTALAGRGISTLSAALESRGLSLGGPHPVLDAADERARVSVARCARRPQGPPASEQENHSATSASAAFASHTHPSATSIKTPPITYLHLYSCREFSIGIFCLPPGASIPLHDHPGMTVFSRLPLGCMHLKSYDWLDQETGKGAGPSSRSADLLGDLEGFSTAEPFPAPTAARLARLVEDTTISAPESSTHVLFSRTGGNIHTFNALSECAVLDVLAPPYDAATGRNCTYYRELDPTARGLTALGLSLSDGEDLVKLRRGPKWKGKVRRKGSSRGAVGSGMGAGGTDGRMEGIGQIDFLDDLGARKDPGFSPLFGFRPSEESGVDLLPWASASKDYLYHQISDAKEATGPHLPPVMFEAAAAACDAGGASIEACKSASPRLYTDQRNIQPKKHMRGVARNLPGDSTGAPSRLGNVSLLEPFQPPEDFVVSRGTYCGPKVTHRRNKLASLGWRHPALLMLHAFHSSRNINSISRSSSVSNPEFPETLLNASTRQPAFDLRPGSQSQASHEDVDLVCPSLAVGESNPSLWPPAA